MSPEAINNLVFIFVGWLLSTLTTFVAFLVNRRRKTRKVFTDLIRIIEDLIIQLELTKAWRKVRRDESTPNIFEIEETWKTSIPLEPPKLPDNFDAVLSSISEWEAQRGKYTFTKRLISKRDGLNALNNIYDRIEKHAKNNNPEDIPEETLNFYQNNLSDFDEDNRNLISQIYPYQKMWIFRKKDKLIERLKLLYNNRINGGRSHDFD